VVPARIGFISASMSTTMRSEGRHNTEYAEISTVKTKLTTFVQSSNPTECSYRYCKVCLYCLNLLATQLIKMLNIEQISYCLICDESANQEVVRILSPSITKGTVVNHATTNSALCKYRLFHSTIIRSRRINDDCPVL